MRLNDIINGPIIFPCFMVKFGLVRFIAGLLIAGQFNCVDDGFIAGPLICLAFSKIKFFYKKISFFTA
jgi:hypothetical protein